MPVVRNLDPITWPLLPQPDSAGRMQWPDLETSVMDNIKVILQTRPGEQLFRPNYGAGLQEFVGRQDTTDTRREIQETVKDALNRWEPRIDLESVDLYQDPERPSWLRVEIRFRLRRTGAARQLGLSLSLENG